MLELIEESWHWGLILLTPAVKPRYRKLFVGIVVVGGVWHTVRHFWRG